MGAKVSTEFQKLFFFRKCTKLIPKWHTPHFELKLFRTVNHRFKTHLQKFLLFSLALGSLGPQYVFEHVSFGSKMIFFSYYSCKSVKYRLTLKLKLYHCAPLFFSLAEIKMEFQRDVVPVNQNESERYVRKLLGTIDNNIICFLILIKYDKCIAHLKIHEKKNEKFIQTATKISVFIPTMWIGNFFTMQIQLEPPACLKREDRKPHSWKWHDPHQHMSLLPPTRILNANVTVIKWSWEKSVFTIRSDL